MRKILLLCVMAFMSILFFNAASVLAFQIIPQSSSRFPGRASDGSEAFTQQTYRVICNDGHEISCLENSYHRLSGLAVGCAADNRQGHKLYVTNRRLMELWPKAIYLPSASVESIGSAFCINAAPEGSR